MQSATRLTKLGENSMIFSSNQLGAALGGFQRQAQHLV
jgi:hypothetical protein